jgi:signal transduction histidine kinase
VRGARGPSIRLLLLGAHAFALLLPLAALFLLRVYDVYLLRQTEHRLISESVVIGEVFRDALLRALGREQDVYRPPPRPARSGGSAYAAPSEPFSPVEAQIDFAHPVLAREPSSFPSAPATGSAAERAGQAIEALLRRAQTFNLSAIRVLDARGCVVASTRSQAGQCMAELPEVRAALGGVYTAVLRERISDEPAPQLGDIRRRGKVRVFTALPVWSDGRVIGVVRASRTGLDALSSLWANRRGLVWIGVLGSLLVVAISVAFAAAIAGPLGRLTRAAREVAAGRGTEALAVGGMLPREIGVLREVLLQMAQKLERRASYVQEFASQVSHELKTPLTAVRGAAELLQQGLHDMPDADRARFLGNILEDAQRMERLVARLLELARRENEPRGAAPELSPAEQVQKALARHGDRAQLVVEADAPARIAIEPEQLDSVLGNLVENALRHGAGSPVRVTLRTERGRLRIDVHDRGPGVSEANRKRLFERFFTTQRDQGGTGLGLAIVRAIAEARGGSVAAHFDASGSTFSVVL